MIKNITIDIKGLEKQINNLKKEIESGVREGLDNSRDYVVGMMKHNIRSEIYQAYDPVRYQRTKDFYNSVVAESNVTDIPSFNTNINLWVYSDPDKLGDSFGQTVNGLMTEHNNLPYSFRIFFGDSVFRYEYHPSDGSIAEYMQARDWVTPTMDAVIQGNTFMKYITDAIKRKAKAVK